MPRYFLIFTITAKLLVCSSFLSAEILYKWNDKDGITHFGAHPPTEAINIETVEIEDTPGDTEAKSWQTIRQEQQASDKAAQDATSLDQALDAARKDKNALCQQAKQARIDLESRHRVRLQQEDGSYRVLSQEEKEAQIKQAEEAIAEYCG
ncbi:DUF4124 domain-containing protein [Spongorhabdus nitratireducens]